MDQVFLDNMLKSKIKPRTKHNLGVKTVPNNLTPLQEVYAILTQEFLGNLFNLKEDDYMINTSTSIIVDKDTFAAILTILKFEPRNNHEVVAKDMIISIILTFLMNKPYKKPKITSKILKDSFNQMYQFITPTKITSKEVK